MMMMMMMIQTPQNGFSFHLNQVNKKKFANGFLFSDSNVYHM